MTLRTELDVIDEKEIVEVFWLDGDERNTVILPACKAALFMDDADLEREVVKIYSVLWKGGCTATYIIVN